MTADDLSRIDSILGEDASPRGSAGLSGLLAGLRDPDRDVRQESALALGERADEATLAAVLQQLWVEPDFFVRETLTWAAVRSGEAALPLVLEELAHDRDGATRAQALHVLSKIAAPSTVDHIVALIDDADPAVAAKARWALARIGDESAVPLLAAHLGAGDAEAQNALTDVLASFGTAAVPELVDALGRDETAVRKHAADVLGYVGSPHAEPAVQALGSVIDDSETEVAVSALMALGSLSGEEATRTIERSTRAQNPRVRAVAERLAARAPKRSRVEELKAARAARAAGAS